MQGLGARPEWTTLIHPQPSTLKLQPQPYLGEQVAHRDLKSLNILMLNGCCMISDFGLSKVIWCFGALVLWCFGALYYRCPFLHRTL